MKKIILTLAIAGLFLFGCSDVGVNPNMPANNNQNNTTLNKKGLLNLDLDSPFSVTQTINGAEGGTITLDKSWGIINTHASLFFPPNSFEGTETITMTVDPLTASVSFYPSMVFETRLDLDLSFDGLNLVYLGLNSNKVDFYYQADDGLLSLIKNNGVSVSVSTGTLSVKNAGLYHFSRYIFAK